MWFVAVVICRFPSHSRQDQFFRTHPVFGSLAQRSGIQYLAQFLNGVLMKHICGAFPEIKALVSQRVVEQEQELESYGEEVSKNPGELVLCGTSLPRFVHVVLFPGFLMACQGKTPTCVVIVVGVMPSHAPCFRLFCRMCFCGICFNEESSRVAFSELLI